jgi:hypothetical protein
MYQRNLPGCCSVGLLYGLSFIDQQALRNITSRSGHFIAIFSQVQHEGFKKVNKKYRCVSATRIPGGHGVDLAVCVFKGKKDNQ